MSRLKTFLKYIIWVVAFTIFSYVLTYIGLNSTYKDMLNKKDVPEQIQIDVAQSTKVNGKIYGKVTNNSENDVKDKYIKVNIYSKNNTLIGTKYLQISGINENETKKFEIFFTAENIKYYTIEIIDNNSDEINQKIEQAKNEFSNIFKDENLTTAAIVALVLVLAF